MHKKEINKLCIYCIKMSKDIKRYCEIEHEKNLKWGKYSKTIHNLIFKCYNKISYIQQEVISW